MAPPPVPERQVTQAAALGVAVVMVPWTLHNLSTNCAATPRFVVTHTVNRD
jgi:hypothetical protein